MIGEMRDHETAHIGIEASLTGHLVLSTLHTNSAPETIVRLMDMGLDPFSFADALLGVLAQRLARTLCASCRVSGAATQDEFDALRQAYGAEEFDQNLGLSRKDVELFSAPGCSECRMTGYKGRIALHELLTHSPELKTAIGKKARAQEVRELAKKTGMRTLLQDGIEKVIAGKTDFAQVLAVCQ
jgi:type II secretory ATPase GspE/PulE/Tfp pilus assembly ATPase PilB-like protein